MVFRNHLSSNGRQRAGDTSRVASRAHACMPRRHARSFSTPECPPCSLIHSICAPLAPLLSLVVTVRRRHGRQAELLCRYHSSSVEHPWSSHSPPPPSPLRPAILGRAGDRHSSLAIGAAAVWAAAHVAGAPRSTSGRAEATGECARASRCSAAAPPSPKSPLRPSPTSHSASSAS